MQSLIEFLRAPEMRLFYWVLPSVVAAWIIAALFSRLVLFLRDAFGGKTPYVDQTVHNTWLFTFLVGAVLPSYALYDLGMESYVLKSYRYLTFMTPDAAAVLGFLLGIIKLIGKQHPEPIEEED